MDHKEELKRIISKVAIKQNRAVLVILKYIDNANKLKLFLSEDASLKDNIITGKDDDEIIKEAINNKEINEDKINTSYNKIMKLKNATK